MIDESLLIGSGRLFGGPSGDDEDMSHRVVRVLVAAVFAGLAVGALVLLSGLGRPAPHLGPALDLDGASAHGSSSPLVSPSAVPSTVASMSASPTPTATPTRPLTPRPTPNPRPTPPATNGTPAPPVVTASPLPPVVEADDPDDSDDPDDATDPDDDPDD